MFKSILVQPGEHYIRFNFTPTNYGVYKSMRELALLFLIGCVFFYIKLKIIKGGVVNESGVEANPTVLKD